MSVRLSDLSQDVVRMDARFDARMEAFAHGAEGPAAPSAGAAELSGPTADEG
ncbi:hypothetical protein SMICM304S_07683 [Streptomyces microflavus]